MMTLCRHQDTFKPGSEARQYSQTLLQQSVTNNRQNWHLLRIMPDRSIYRWFRTTQTRRKTMKRLLAVGVASIAAAFMSADTAEAQCYYGNSGYSRIGSGISIGYSNYSYPRSSFSIGYSSYPSYGYSSFSSRSSRRGHYDWHGPSLYPHGNHFHYVPGHWDYHRGRHHH